MILFLAFRPRRQVHFWNCFRQGSIHENLSENGWKKTGRSLRWQERRDRRSRLLRLQQGRFPGVSGQSTLAHLVGRSVMNFCTIIFLAWNSHDASRAILFASVHVIALRGMHGSTLNVELAIAPHRMRLIWSSPANNLFVSDLDDEMASPAILRARQRERQGALLLGLLPVPVPGPTLNPVSSLYDLQVWTDLASPVHEERTRKWPLPYLFA
jgi:hypothetical protein